MSVVRLGYIGSGIAPQDLHWPALKNLQDKFAVVAVCGKGEENARKFATMVGGATVTTRYAEILSRDDVEAVVVAPPFELNYRIVRDALKARKHVLVEKPLASNRQDARKLAAFAAKSDLVTMTAENWRYRPIFLRMRQLIEEKSIGKPFAVFLSDMGKLSIENKYLKVSTWRRHLPFPPMFMYDGSVHCVAALRFIFGEIEAGIAVTTQLTKDLEKIDSMTYQMLFRSGVHGTMNFYLNSIGHHLKSMIVLGTAGSMHAENNFNTLTIRTAAREEVEEMGETDEGYRAEFLDFYRAIREGRKPVSTFAEAYGDVRAIAHALESVKSWKRLRIRP